MKSIEYLHFGVIDGRKAKVGSMGS